MSLTLLNYKIKMTIDSMIQFIRVGANQWDSVTINRLYGSLELVIKWAPLGGAQVRPCTPDAEKRYPLFIVSFFFFLNS